MERYTELDQFEHKQTKIAFLLCFFFGCCGIHRFYQKKWGTGLLYLLTFGLFVIGWAVDCISLATKLQYFANKKKEKYTSIKQIRNSVVLWIILPFCLLIMIAVSAANSEISSGSNTEVIEETQPVQKEDKFKIEFINKCQADLSYSDPETSFGTVYDVIRNDLHCENFSYNGLSPTAGLDLIKVFIKCEAAEDWLDYDKGYDMVIAFENENLYYIVFDNKTFWENGETFYDYSYIKEYYDAHYVSYGDESQVMVNAQFIIEDYLLIPDSAIHSDQKVGRNGNLYIVTGVVESMNAFGVMIPYEYVVEFQDNSAIYVRIGDQSYGEYIPIS